MKINHRFSEVTGFVLAGGASRRMGQDKAAIRLGQESMVERQIRLLHGVCRSMAVIGPPSNFECLSVPVYSDELPGRGPLGGILTGLHRTRTEFNLFLGCDLPFLEARFLSYLCQQAVWSGADVTVPAARVQGLQTLTAVYRRRALPAIRASLAAGENKVRRFFPRVCCRVIAWREIARAGFPPYIFDNMNTLADYQYAKTMLAARGL